MDKEFNGIALQAYLSDECLPKPHRPIPKVPETVREKIERLEREKKLNIFVEEPVITIEVAGHCKTMLCSKENINTCCYACKNKYTCENRCNNNPEICNCTTTVVRRQHTALSSLGNNLRGNYRDRVKGGIL